jgi:hypothetical protein
VSVTVLEEPLLEFRYGQQLQDPHDGLALFGPTDADAPSHPKSVNYAVVGPPEGIKELHTFTGALNTPLVTTQGRLRDALLWPPYPGFEAVFDATLNPEPVAAEPIDRESLLHTARINDPNQRAYRVVDAYLKAIQRLAQRDEAISVIICVVPDEIWRNCRPRSIVADPIGKKPPSRERALRQKQPDLFGEYQPEEYEYSVDFRRQLKARAMPAGIPLQIVLESTLCTQAPTSQSRRNLTFLSDRAWNLSTTLYYKAGGKPWRLATARPGVCYVGIAFRKAEQTMAGSTSACCAAQMFLDTGDGVVFRGEYGPWYSPASKEFRLSKDSATDLLRGVLKAYHDQGGQELKEIFLHARAGISSEEFEGYRAACPGGTRLVGIRVRTERQGFRAYRQGTYPVLRGTLWPTSDRRAYLWATGFKPSLLTYDGWEVPAPLRIDIQHGEAPIEQVARDILGLTKLNYNACRLGDSAPVTIGFSDMVGEILIANPRTAKPRPNFKYYI